MVILKQKHPRGRKRRGLIFLGGVCVRWWVSNYALDHQASEEIFNRTKTKISRTRVTEATWAGF